MGEGMGVRAEKTMDHCLNRDFQDEWITGM
jgi:hypothetical protein